jgi:hypothetical protein
MNCEIYGIDIDPSCKQFEKDNVKILIGDQSDTNFLNHIKIQIPKIDILIDDGSHINSHIIKTFENLYPNISDGGVYLIEDVHTSYWQPYGGGLNNPGSCIEYFKNKLDEINAKHIYPPRDLTFSNITKSVSFYDSIIAIEKKTIPHDLVVATIRGPGK